MKEIVSITVVILFLKFCHNFHYLVAERFLVQLWFPHLILFISRRNFAPIESVTFIIIVAIMHKEIFAEIHSFVNYRHLQEIRYAGEFCNQSSLSL